MYCAQVERVDDGECLQQPVGSVLFVGGVLEDHERHEVADCADHTHGAQEVLVDRH